MLLDDFLPGQQVLLTYTGKDNELDIFNKDTARIDFTVNENSTSAHAEMFTVIQCPHVLSNLLSISSTSVML